MDNPILPTAATGNSTQGSSSTRLLVQIQQGIDGLTPGKSVEALVIGKDGTGNPLLNLKLQSTKLELPFSSRIPLSQGAKLELKILENTVTNTQTNNNTAKPDANKPPILSAQVVKVNGETPQQPTTVNVGTPTAPTSETGQAKPQAFDVIRALLPNFIKNNIPSQAGQAANTAQTSSINSQAAIIASSGAKLQANLLSVLDGAANFLPKTAPSSTTPNAALQNLSAYNAQNSQGNSGGATNILKAGTGLQLQVISSNVPNAAGVSTPPPATTFPAGSGLPFTATVIGTAEQSGNLVLRTPLGTIKLVGDTSLPKGTELTLAITATGSPTPSATLENAPITLETIRQQIISSNSEFHNLIRALDGLETPQAQQAKELIPQNNQQAASRLLWFMGGVSTGDAERWLGQDVRRQLENAGQKELLSKLDQQFSVMRDAFHKPNEAGWNSLLFPFHDGDKVQFGTFYSRRHKTKNEFGEEKDNTRFVVDIGLDQLGEVQLDGLIQDPDIGIASGGQKNLNLVIRSKTPLPENMQADIYELFGDALFIGGLEGNLRFETTKNSPVHPDYAGEDDHHGDFVV